MVMSFYARGVKNRGKKGEVSPQKEITTLTPIAKSFHRDKNAISKGLTLLIKGRRNGNSATLV